MKASSIAEAVYGAVREAAVAMRPDVLDALEQALAEERSPRGRVVLEQLIENARIAREDGVPLCQDTGTVTVWIELGAEECLEGDLQREIDQAVRRAYSDGALRMSVARDALLDRGNTGDNNPAFVELVQASGRGARVSVMLKGGGSDNASRVAMLDPADGTEGVKRFVLETVEAKAASACPPLLVGVGVGSTFDRVAALSKKALLRRIGTPAADPGLAAIEEEILSAVNGLGIGPGGLGGTTTALAVHAVTAPCHIASLPVAVNVGCCAIRSVSVDVG